MSTTLSVANAQVNPPDATVLADDLVAGTHYPIVKLDLGGAGSSAPVVASVPINDGGNSVTVDGTVAVSGTVPVSVAAVVHVDDNASSLTVDGTVAVSAVAGTVTIAGAVTNAGTFAVQATQAGTWTVQPGNTPNTTPWLVSTKTDLAPSAPTAASVGVASAQAVAANASRKGLYLVNTSNATISIGLGSAAVLNSGITLFPRQAFWMDEYCLDTGAVNAIASAAASNLAIQEVA